MVEVTKNDTASSQSSHTDVHTSPKLIHRQIPNNINIIIIIIAIKRETVQ